jgi:hypothetical protein
MEMTSGLFVEYEPFEAEDRIGGVDVHAEIGWLDGRPVIDRLTYTRSGNIEIGTAVIRSVSLPALVQRATSKGVRLWADAAGTVEFDPSRQDGETLEQWAARLGYAAAAMQLSPAGYIADVQGVSVATANQRLVTARKMGLVPSFKKGSS